MQNAFTIDVEDYFQVEAFSGVIDRANWESYESRVERNTSNILDILDSKGVKGTFFILGWVAKRYPHIVRNIAERGHEIASHGMSHKLVYKQTRTEFRDETRDSKKLLEDICQKPVVGYRAATYSITKESLWAMDILIEEGFLYDSSIFPMRHDKYGIPDINPFPHEYKSASGSIIEFPISVLKRFGTSLPIAGGGYFRLWPYFFSKWGLNQINKEGKQFIFYLHPWEVDPQQQRIQNASLFSKFRHYNNLDKCQRRLERLLDDFRFTTVSNILKEKGLLAS